VGAIGTRPAPGIQAPGRRSPGRLPASGGRLDRFPAFWPNSLPAQPFCGLLSRAVPTLARPLQRLTFLALSLVGLASLAAGACPGDALARGKTSASPAPAAKAKKGGAQAASSGKSGKSSQTAKSGHGPATTHERAGKARKGKRRRGVGAHEPPHHTPSLPLLARAIRCPEEMVAVGGRFCVDRFEATLVEPTTHELVSPFYPPTTRLTAWSVEKWSAARAEAAEGSMARDMPLPPVPAFQLAAFKPKAMSWPGSTPSGYVSGENAAEACRSAGKRLCKEEEWVTACRGEQQTQFPYGKTYRQDACNVFREDHPAHVLHGDSSAGLSDPRLNQIEVDGKPLLRPTGSTSTCASKWGDDAVYDMVGNLDEWVDDAEGTFVGGFYARSTRNGCDARVRTHPVNYFDYSLGVRCCKDPG
jgi:formylglycine-generating enzyme